MDQPLCYWVNDTIVDSMPFRENLVSTEIVDKNGRRTVVYRKGRPSKTVSGVPSPHKNKYTMQERAVLVQKIEAGISGGKTDPRTANILSQYPDILLDRLWDSYSSQTENFWMVLGHVRDNSAPAFVSEALHFYPLVQGQMMTDVTAIVRAIHNYSQLPASEDYSREPLPIRMKAEALVKVISAAVRVFGSYGHFRKDSELVFKDDYFTEFVLNRYEKADRIAEIIRERKTLDRFLIHQVLESPANALGDGTL